MRDLRILEPWTTPGFSRSDDRGKTWNCDFFVNTVPTSMKLDPSNPRRIFIGGYDGGPLDGGVDGLFRSENAGDTWWQMTEGLPGGEIYSVAIDAIQSLNLYVSLGAGVFKSSNGGMTWSSFNTGLENIPVFDLLVDPKDSNRVYAATSFGVYSIDQLP